MLTLVVFPRRFDYKRAEMFLKFKRIRYDLRFVSENYLLFYQDNKYVPNLDAFDMFTRKIINEERILENIEKASEVEIPIILDNKKDFAYYINDFEVVNTME